MLWVRGWYLPVYAKHYNNNNSRKRVVIDILSKLFIISTHAKCVFLLTFTPVDYIFHLTVSYANGIVAWIILLFTLLVWKNYGPFPTWRYRWFRMRMHIIHTSCGKWICILYVRRRWVFNRFYLKQKSRPWNEELIVYYAFSGGPWHSKIRVRYF